MTSRILLSSLLATALACSALRAVPEVTEDIEFLSNGNVTVGLDRSKGASLSYLSWGNYEKNAVNHRDPGRLIQQSYYAGIRRDRREEGQGKNWSPWSWNPIQGGGIKSWARIATFERVGKDSIYSETIPKLWDMPDEEAAAVMKQWTGFEEGFSNVIVVRCELVCDRAPDDPWGPARLNPQEIPACYFTRNFNTAKSYLGKKRWRAEEVRSRTPWSKATPPKQAMAFFEKNGQGIGIFSPTASAGPHWNYGGNGGGLSDDPKAPECMHVAPIARIKLGPQSTYAYRYWLILGTEKEIAASLDKLLAKYSKEKHILN